MGFLPFPGGAVIWGKIMPCFYGDLRRGLAMPPSAEKRERQAAGGSPLPDPFGSAS
jgi:hypothetical protein